MSFHSVFHRSYRIDVTRKSDWIAFVFPPGTEEPMDVAVVATPEEGEDVLIERAREMIDGELRE